MPRKSKRLKDNTAVLVAIIAAAATLITAIIGLAAPFVNRLAEKMIQDPTPSQTLDLTIAPSIPTFTPESTTTPDDLLLVDDFSVNRDIPVWNDDYSFAEIVDGVYRIGVLVPNTVFWSNYKFLNVSDFRARVDINMPISKNTYSCGIILRSNNDGAYFFAIRSDSQFSFTNYAHDANTNEWVWIDIASWEANSAVKSRGVNTIEIVALYDTFELFVNGIQVKTVTDTTYRNGEIGFFAATYGGGPEIVVEFDNFIVEER